MLLFAYPRKILKPKQQLTMNFTVFTQFQRAFFFPNTISLKIAWVVQTRTKTKPHSQQPTIRASLASVIATDTAITR